MRVTTASRTQREAAVELLEDIPRRRRITLGADKGYDVPAFVEQPGMTRKVRRRRDVVTFRTGNRTSPWSAPTRPDLCRRGPIDPHGSLFLSLLAPHLQPQR
jgi:hypothetical protein